MLLSIPDFLRMLRQETRHIIQAIRYGENCRLFIQLMHHGEPLDLRINGRTLEGLRPYNIPDSGILIGRDSSCPWEIPQDESGRTSRRHAMLTCGRTNLVLRRGPVLLKDLGSTRGIKVQDKDVPEVILRPGLRCVLGDVELVITEKDDEQVTNTKQTFHRLEQLNGDDKGMFYELTQDTIILGSAPAQEDGSKPQTQLIVCNHSSVSRNHAAIKITNQGRICKIVDLHSRNHTKINNENLPFTLKDGQLLQDRDIISLGYLRFRYHQRGSVAILDYIVPAIFTAFVTMGILIFLYVIIIWILPDAGDYVRQSDNQAMSGRYGKALEILVKAETARHHESYSQEIKARKSFYTLLIANARDWKEIQVCLTKGDFVTARRKMDILMQKNGDKVWEGMENEYRIADAVDKLLNAISKAEDLVTDVHTLTEKKIKDNTSISNIRQELDKALNQVPQDLTYVQQLLGTAVALKDELLEMEQQYKRLKEILAALQENGAGKAMNEAISLQKEIEEHIAEKKDRKTYRNVLNALHELCETEITKDLSPMELLCKAEEVYKHNLKLAMSLEFDQIQEGTPLHAWKKLPEWPTLDGQCQKMQERHENLLEKIGNVEKNIEKLSFSSMNYGNQLFSPPMKNLQSMNHAVLNCGCLRNETYLANDHKWPIDDYDRLLGIDLFWACLDNKGQFSGDLNSYSEKNGHRLPDLFQLKQDYANLERFHSLMKAEEYHELSSTFPGRENKLKKMLDWAETRMSNYTDMMDKWMTEAAKYTRPDALRKSLILTGMALVLAPYPQKYEDDYNTRYEEYLKWRNSFQNRLKRPMTEAKRENALQEILERGIPGDPLVAEVLRQFGGRK
jgi:hypothetical protein